jgi:drug/metabolite transporter (DMT)-like permease
MSSANLAAAKATGLIVFSACCFGSLTTLTLFVTRAGLSLLPAMVWRYCLAAVAMIILARAPILRGGVTRRQALRLMLVGGCGQALITYLSLRALDYLPVGPLGFLFYTYPAWVVLIAAVTGKEELTLVRLVALSVAMAGITVMVGTPFSEPLDATGVMLALGTAVLYAIYLPALHSVQKGVPAIPASFYLICGVFISFLVAGTITGSLEMPETLREWGLVILLSLVGTVLAFVALLAGLRVLGPVRTSIIATIEPFFTAMLGVLLLGEIFSLTMLSGGALIAIAVLLLQWAGRVKEEAEPAV